jgi:pimeloyl-ACP methyl ester carboxylesterase
MPGVSHMLHLEAPAEFHGHVLPFFAGHPAS